MVRDILASQSGLDRIKNILGLQAIAGHRFAVHFYLEEWFSLDAAWRDSGRTRDALNDAFDFERLCLQCVKVVAKNLHAELCADPGGDHQHSVLDWLQKTRNSSGNLAHFLRQFVDELLLRHSRRAIRSAV